MTWIEPGRVGVRPAESLISTVRSLVEDELMVGGVIGGSDAYVESWDIPLDDAMARIHDEHVVQHADQNWVFGIWFMLTERGEQAARALGTEKSEG